MGGRGAGMMLQCVSYDLLFHDMDIMLNDNY